MTRDRRAVLAPREAVVLLRDRSVARDAVAGNMSMPLRVASAQHHFVLPHRPRVEVETPDEGNSDTESAVLTTALEAVERSVRQARPRRLVLAAVRTLHVPRQQTQRVKQLVGLHLRTSGVRNTTALYQLVASVTTHGSPWRNENSLQPPINSLEHETPGLDG